MVNESGRWWGPQEVELGQLVRWRIAGLSLWIRRSQREWKVAWSWPEEWAPTADVSREDDAPYPDETNLPVERYVFENTDSPLQLWPATADRPVVTTPRIPFFLGPREKTRLYVGTPLWLSLRSASGDLLREFPIRRPSDTFFGPTTLEGEVCYATRSKASLDRDNIQWMARRATTAVNIRNDSNKALPVERLKIPVTMLSIFAGGSKLWTESLDVDVDHGEMAKVTVRPGPPAEAEGAELLNAPRQAPEASGRLMRVFDGLFSRQEGL